MEETPRGERGACRGVQLEAPAQTPAGRDRGGGWGRRSDALTDERWVRKKESPKTAPNVRPEWLDGGGEGIGVRTQGCLLGVQQERRRGAGHVRFGVQKKVQEKGIWERSAQRQSRRTGRDGQGREGEGLRPGQSSGRGRDKRPRRRRSRQGDRQTESRQASPRGQRDWQGHRLCHR